MWTRASFYPSTLSDKYGRSFNFVGNVKEDFSMSKKAQLAGNQANHEVLELFDPKSQGKRPAFDASQRFQAISANTPPLSEPAKQAFLALRTRNMIERTATMEMWDRSLPDAASADAVGAAWPVGYGRGTGLFYRPGSLSFASMSSLSYVALAPPAAGGTLSDFLYLTASNRSTYGAEAILAYQAQDMPVLTIFDWSQISLPLAQRFHSIAGYSYLLGNGYLRPVIIGAENFSSLRLVNTTVLLGGTTWQNKVSVENSAGDLELIYHSTYTLVSNTQQADHSGLGFFGPIVETYLPIGGPLAAMGFATPILSQDGADRPFKPADVAWFKSDPGIARFDRYADWSFLVS
jgi:hypothetical protein